VLLGGGNFGNGNGRYADKVIKVPSKRGPQALRAVLDDFDANGNGSSFVDYYEEKGQMYFYDFLKPLSATDNLEPSDFIDWGNTEKYKKAIGVGECAGVMIDLVATLLFDSEEKIQNAELALEDKKWAAGIYHAYSSMINTAKALLTMEDTKTNTHIGIIKDFDEKFVASGRIAVEGGFENLTLRIKKNEPTETFAKSYLEEAKGFLKSIEAFRNQELAEV